ncbi:MULTISPECIES: hypothetical protein [unclassified Mesorhizobium]|uniref:hypothetical protein n=1 Tax=unclassified Mesorhizobium TaxID=325217 RepID=UPI0016741488|nr:MULTISPECIES: hypothetical protein [unclassified Mesorhizobium]
MGELVGDGEDEEADGSRNVCTGLLKAEQRLQLRTGGRPYWFKRYVASKALAIISFRP